MSFLPRGRISRQPSAFVEAWIIDEMNEYYLRHGKLIGRGDNVCDSI
jgi:hypothetical protein